MNLNFRQRSVPFALLLLCVLGFGLLVPWLGYYQDDWLIIWLARSFPARIMIESFAHERPFFAAIYTLTTKLLGDSPLVWQIFGLFSRWLAALAAWWGLSVIWPKHTRQTTWIAFLFAIYPSFKEQYIPVSFSQLFLLLALIFFSFGAMIQAIRQPGRRWLLNVLALLSAAFSMFSAEYFFGLELLRPIFLWFVHGEQTVSLKERLKRTLLSWLPYLLVVFSFLFWRLFIFKFPTYEPKLAQRMQTDSRTTVIRLAQTIVQDAFDMMVFAWTQTLDFVKTIQPSLSPALMRWGIILAFAAAIAFYFYHLEKDGAETGNNDTTWSRQAIFTGLVSLLATGWPYWFTGLPVELEMSNDRFTLAFTFGASILLVGLIERLVRTHLQKAAILGILVGLAVGMHFQIALTFRSLNANQTTFFRQLAWRVPALKPNTLILVDNASFPYAGSNAMSAAVNWIYGPDKPAERMDYQWFFLPDKLGGDLTDLSPNQSIEVQVYPLKFKGSTSQALVVQYSPGACVQVLEPGVHDQLPRLPALIEQALPLSNTAFIDLNADVAAARVADIFGAAGAPDWCYYFEKADLARQRKDWQSIAQIGNESARLDLKPAVKNEMEYLPFIEGYAQAGDWDKAKELTRKTLNSLPAMRPLLCTTWTRISMQTSASSKRDETISTIFQTLECGVP